MPMSKYSPKQKRLAAVAEPRDKITGADLKSLRMGKKADMKKTPMGKAYMKAKGKKKK